MEDTGWKYASAAVAALVCIAVTALAYGVTMSVKRRRLPPGPFPWPIVGNLLSLGTHPHQTYARMAKKYGNIFTLYIGGARVVVVTNAAMAKEVLLLQDSKFASRPVHDLMHTCAKHMNPDGNSSFSVSLWSPKVREMRQICDRPLMAPRTLHATCGNRREEVWRTVGLVAKDVQDRKPSELRELFMELALRLSCRTAFNKAFVHAEDNLDTGGSTLSPEVFWKLDRQFSELLVTQNPSDIIPSLKPFGDLFGVNKRWQLTFGTILQVSSTLQDWYRKHAPDDIDPALADREVDESRLDLFQVLMRKAQEGSLSDAAVNHFNTEVLMAGADTNAVTFEWFMLELMRHPHVMQKLRAEIDAKFGDSSPVDEELLLELPYLEAVLKEVFRLHHPAPMSIPHYTTEETVIGGYRIPAGTSAVTDLWAIGRDVEIWGDDAYTFNPDRFLQMDVNVLGTIDTGFVPFSAGRRICPGRQVAVHSILLAMAALVHAFEWDALPRDELSAEEAAGGLNCRNINPLVLQARPRPHISLSLYACDYRV